MKKEEMEKHRPGVVADATGVVLEIGFGSGLNLPFYKNISKLYALDPSKELYVLAQEHIKDVVFSVEYIQASAEKIPLADKTVDAVVSTWSLCSVPDVKLALKEIARVLKRDGKFLFIEHGKSPKRNIAWWQKVLTPGSKLFAGGCHLDRDMESLITEAGFVFEQLEKFEQKSKPLAFMYKGAATLKN
jgi:ubiquinone/menaquinone biosynthesis C-methylase UbiE